MKKNLLNHFVINHIKSIEQNLSNYIKNKDPENLHRLRVDLKKINALLSFAENVYKEEYNKGMIKPLFSEAGKIREIQINIRILELMLHPPKKIIEQLKNKENILTIDFIKCGSRYLSLIKNFRKIIYLPEKLPNKIIIINYFKSEKNKANKKLKKQERVDLHKYRSKIKKLMYVYCALPKKIKKEIEFNEEKINRQQEELGDWHDTYSVISFLSQEHFTSKANEELVKLKEKEKRQFNSLLRNLKNEYM
jgi:CHAD domain-containing protein